ncbi:MAG TPA: sigma-70 family RNA polymerase sigma factor [Humisphaera sp.]|jgi:RNA polymerase sigma factor (sigma-70 family)|nr:sigma-70 family RNA polymerase sigma factor [Humisphaera sp.]
MEATSQQDHPTGDDSVADSTEALVLRAQRKDGEAFAQLIRRYERVTLSVAYGVLSNSDAAGDMVQEAFLRAWQRMGELKEPARFGTWVCGIARNLAIDSRRRNKNLKLAGDSTAFESSALIDDRYGADPLDELSRKERHEMVGRALQSLDDATRPAVILRYYDGLSSREIGQLLELSPAAVDMRLSRARQQLKGLLATTQV